MRWLHYDSTAIRPCYDQSTTYVTNVGLPVCVTVCGGGGGPGVLTPKGQRPYGWRVGVQCHTLL